MRKQGFTLIELLGVLIILSAIVLIVFPSILNQVKKSQRNIDGATKALLSSATELYLGEHKNTYGMIENDVYCISIHTLIADEKLTTASDSLKKLDNFNFVKVNIGNDKIKTYEVVESCTEVNTTPSIPNEPDLDPGSNSNAPTIEFTGSDIIPDTQNTFDALEGVLITDDNTPRSEIKVNVIGEVSLGIVGKYPIVYEAIDKDSNVTTKTRVIEVVKTEYLFSYTGSYQEFTVPIDGTYQVELWGASGGSTSYSKENMVGGYTKGTISLKKDKTYYLFVGGRGANRDSTAFGGYNGGGHTTKTPGGKSGSAGGGATDIRTYIDSSGTWNDFESLKSRIMVAAGGAYDGPAGGVVGYEDVNNKGVNYYYYVGKGGTQTSGGETPTKYTATCIASSNGTAGSFGSGGTGGANSSSDGRNGGGAGGGSGYYGGSGASGTCNGTLPAGGGSSFISGHSGCDAVSEESTSTNIIHTGQPNHYSGLVFTNTVMIDGLGYRWTAVKEAEVGIPNYDGTGTLTVNEVRDGYAKITYIIE